MVHRGTKFTGICIAIYLVYALFVFFVLPLLLPDPVTMARNFLTQQIGNLGPVRNMSLESGGNPKRSILVTFRGSGAIGLLDFLSRQPGCYHHFSPLVAYRNQITDVPNAERALDELHALLKCDYNRSNAMIDEGMKTPTFRNFYGIQYKICQTYSTEVCANPETMAKICRLFPFLNMSVYNLALRYLRTLLECKDLNVRMLLLVRDPRATMASRTDRTWCQSLECVLPGDLCRTMVDNYDIAEILLKKYPGRFGVVRYEELALEPFDGLNNVLHFYGLPTINPTELKAVKNSTDEIENMKKFFEHPVLWTRLFTPKKIMDIQDTCRKAMSLWGYYPIKDLKADPKDTFIPLNKLPLFSL